MHSLEICVNSLKISPMKPFSCLAICLLIFSLLACEDEGNVMLDNAGESPLIVNVDGVRYSLPARSMKRIQIEPGMHRLTIQDPDGKTLEQADFRVGEGGLINAARARYLIWTELFGDQSVREEKLKQKWLEVGDTEIFGEFYQIPGEELYVEQRWDFGLDEAMPEKVRGWEISDKRWIIKRKLFREAEALAHYKTVSAQPRN